MPDVIPPPPCASFVKWERNSCYIDSFFVCILMGNNALLNQIVQNSTPPFAAALYDVVLRLSSPSRSCSLVNLRTLIHQGPFTGIFDVRETVDKINENGISPGSPFRINVYPQIGAEQPEVPSDTHVFSLILNAERYHGDLVEALLTGTCFSAFEVVSENPTAYKEDLDRAVLRKMCTYLWSGNPPTKHVYGVIVFVGGNHYVCYYKCEASGVWWFYDGLNTRDSRPLSPFTSTAPTPILVVLAHIKSFLRRPQIAYLLVK